VSPLSRARAVPEGHVIVPLELARVVEGLRDKAKLGNPQAARELLSWLTRFPPVLSTGGQDMAAKGLEELDEAELAAFEAWALRRWQRAQQRLERQRAQAAPPNLI
jgi:mono/diheme cytochrome c family protein